MSDREWLADLRESLIRHLLTREARARRLARQIPDANCVTLPDGSCVSEGPCLHSPLPPARMAAMLTNVEK